MWGGLHGLLLVVAHAAARLRLPRLPAPLARIVCFHLVCLGWVFFRAQTLPDAAYVVGSIGALRFGPPVVDVVTFGHAAMGSPSCSRSTGWRSGGGRCSRSWDRQPVWARWAVGYALAVAIVLFGVQSGAQFIYFQF
ncbi:MAG: hypothetical protein R3F59_21260 [Myxococcota bacterium]